VPQSLKSAPPGRFWIRPGLAAAELGKLANLSQAEAFSQVVVHVKRRHWGDPLGRREEGRREVRARMPGLPLYCWAAAARATSLWDRAGRSTRAPRHGCFRA